ncbi:class I SAM-dependent methyltransferase [Bacillus sp. FJAT-49732]|uniref:Class I SAM-dependent methyltransferase n=1 Tax=Lederbergia citrisecunda TaxID=2833583 RepID=A0A942TKV6_9BACI|nr:class I SAM-dependent methyltransferase [Lederbergia citrisecunda]MBS4199980.1 class I SAM-dependent methyltransferase [Lederbergia citrisecunda]
MKVTPVEKLFMLFDETAEILQEELDCTYLEALAESGENLFHDDILQESLSEVTRKRLKRKYADIIIASYAAEDIRKAFQLSILKGMKGHIQPNHQMTPDTIGFIISYFTDKFLGAKTDLSILDPAVGTGNLLSTIINRQGNASQTRAFGVEVDELLINLAYVGANLQKQQTEFFQQDALEPLFIDPVDLVVCDLPIGYYPNDIQASQFELNASKGHAYAHHLFIEQSIKHTKPGGYLFFLIPNGLFESEEASKLHTYLKRTVYIQGVLQLPLSLFKDNNAGKSILILQKKKPGIEAPKEVLLATLPKLSNKEALDKMMLGMEKWFKENK